MDIDGRVGLCVPFWLGVILVFWLSSVFEVYESVGESCVAGVGALFEEEGVADWDTGDDVDDIDVET